MPWGHVPVLLDKLTGPAQRDWYAAQTVANGCSRGEFTHQIVTAAHTRLGAAPSDFADRPSAPDSNLAQEIVKDPDVFKFLGASTGLAEKDLEAQLVGHLRATRLERSVRSADIVLMGGHGPTLMRWTTPTRTSIA